MPRQGLRVHRSPKVRQAKTTPEFARCPFHPDLAPIVEREDGQRHSRADFHSLRRRCTQASANYRRPLQCGLVDRTNRAVSSYVRGRPILHHVFSAPGAGSRTPLLIASRGLGIRNGLASIKVADQILNTLLSRSRFNVGSKLDRK
jgi:hypothetical protein